MKRIRNTPNSEKAPCLKCAKPCLTASGICLECRKSLGIKSRRATK